MEFIINFWPYLILVFAIVSVGGYGLFSHAVKHTDGTDDIQTADAGQKGLMSSTHHSELETAKTDIDAAEADIDAIEADILAIEADILAIEVDILALEVDVAAIEAEIIAARGSKASIDARLDVEHEEDGSHKGGEESAVKAWIHFNGTGTVAIQDSFNVSALLDNGVGTYAVYWDVDFANNDYACASSIFGWHVSIAGPAVGDIAVTTADSSHNLTDKPVVMIIAIGDQ